MIFSTWNTEQIHIEEVRSGMSTLSGTTFTPIYPTRGNTRPVSTFRGEYHNNKNSSIASKGTGPKIELEISQIRNPRN
jgi:hypothetical protein